MNLEALLPGDPQRLGGYWLAGRLGAGGQGVVYQAYDDSGARVAIKVLHTSDKVRFAKEVTAARRVASFCTAKILAVDLDAAEPYIVSEYVPGPSLREAVEGAGPLAGDRLYRLATAVATALAAIHEAGVIHRDLKPDNVMLGPDGPRVIDFGVARTPEMSLTSTGFVAGTPTYMPPEVFTGQRAGTPADVFAWGGVILYAATGSDPFKDESLGGVMHRVLTMDPDVSVLDEPLRSLVSAALRKRPEDRPGARALLLGLLGSGRPAISQATGSPTTGSQAAISPLDSQAAGGHAAGSQATGSPATGSHAASSPKDFQAGVQTAGIPVTGFDAMVSPAAVALDTPYEDPSLGEVAEAVYEGLGPSDQAMAPQVFLRLTDDQMTRTVPPGELPEEAAEVLRAYRSAGLLDDSVAIVHPALHRAWPRLRGWIDEERDGLPIHRALSDAARRWETGGDVYRGAALEEALRWAATGRRHLTLTRREAAFLEAGTALARRASRRRGLVITALSVLLVVAVVATVVADRQRRVMAEQHLESMARVVAARAEELRGPEPVTAMRLSVAAADLAPVMEARAALYGSLAQPEVATFTDPESPPGAVRTLSANGDTLVSVAGGSVRLYRRTGEVTSFEGVGAGVSAVEISPDGRTLALAAGEKVRLWDVASGRPVGPALPAGTATFSPTGRMLVASDAATSRPSLWDIAGRRWITGLPAASAMVVGPGDRLAAFGLDDGTWKVWDLQRRRILAGLPAEAMAWSPDGGVLALRTGESSFRLWDVAKGAWRSNDDLDLPYKGQVAFTPDSGFVAALGDEGTLRLWRIDDLEPVMSHVVQIGGGAGAIRTAGRTVRLLTEATVVTVDISAFTAPAVLPGLPGPRFRLFSALAGAGFSADGKRLALAHKAWVTVWETATRRRIAKVPGVGDDVGAPALSPDGRTVAVPTASAVVLWDVDSGSKLGSFPGSHAAFSPDGRVMAVVAGSSVDVYDVAARRRTGRLPAGTGPALSRDGGMLASKDPEGGGLQVFDVRSGRRVGIQGHMVVSGAAFSPDGRTLAVSDALVRGRLVLLDTRTWRRVGYAFAGQELAGEHVSISPEGVLAVSDGSVVRLWDLNGRRVMGLPITGYPEGVAALAFGDGVLYITGGDGSLRAFPIERGRAAGAVRARAGGPISADEWRRHIPELPYPGDPGR
ncbi:WD40 repeat domain-containing serine/threonine protein kinase [Nonomuraea sp. bgisy101]|uniref:WD40 repeat domain-containing serine/threonine protein kinase n=1 Tax=Nonomuraea sp. bgisy101 TaxID=3413784 RepID=UPI003D749890